MGLREERAIKTESVRKEERGWKENKRNGRKGHRSEEIFTILPPHAEGWDLTPV